jgi:hypothetical protein
MEPGVGKLLDAWIVVPEPELPVTTFPLSPISLVLFGNTHEAETTMGLPCVAGSRMVEGSGLVIPAQGLAVHVMLVLPELRPRASMTAPVDGKVVADKIPCNIPQILVPAPLDTLASMNAADWAHWDVELQFPLAL